MGECGSEISQQNAFFRAVPALAPISCLTRDMFNDKVFVSASVRRYVRSLINSPILLNFTRKVATYMITVWSIYCI